jgi:hypothetical protein
MNCYCSQNPCGTEAPEIGSFLSELAEVQRAQVRSRRFNFLVFPIRSGYEPVVQIILLSCRFSGIYNTIMASQSIRFSLSMLARISACLLCSSPSNTLKRT